MKKFSTVPALAFGIIAGSTASGASVIDTIQSFGAAPFSADFLLSDGDQSVVFTNGGVAGDPFTAQTGDLVVGDVILSTINIDTVNLVGGGSAADVALGVAGVDELTGLAIFQISFIGPQSLVINPIESGNVGALNTTLGGEVLSADVGFGAGTLIALFTGEANFTPEPSVLDLDIAGATDGEFFTSVGFSDPGDFFTLFDVIGSNTGAIFNATDSQQATGTISNLEFQLSSTVSGEADFIVNSVTQGSGSNTLSGGSGGAVLSDISFQVNATVVPSPAAAGVGLVGIFGLLSRRRKDSAA